MKLPITNWWVASALGVGPTETAENLRLWRAPGMHTISGDIPGRDIFFGTIDAPLPKILEKRWNMRSCRLVELAVEAMRDGIDNLKSKYAADRIGVVLGASNTGIDEAENFVDEWLTREQKPDTLDFSMIELGTPSVYLAERLGLSGPAYTVSTACSSAAKAFGAARRLVELGICDAVITGGVDGRCRFAMNGFSALGALSEGRCRPLAPDRDGINLGEAVALFIIESTANPANPQIFLSGIGESSDAYHATAPDPEGNGAEMAMRAALADAGIVPSDVSYINLHGTGTLANDAMESKAVERVFGSEFALCSSDLTSNSKLQNANCLVESTKALTGHCLGAAGAIEAAICIARLQEMGRRKSAISNSFAFGGSNASVVFQS